MVKPHWVTFINIVHSLQKDLKIDALWLCLWDDIWLGLVNTETWSLWHHGRVVIWYLPQGQTQLTNHAAGTSCCCWACDQCNQTGHQNNNTLWLSDHIVMGHRLHTHAKHPKTLIIISTTNPACWSVFCGLIMIVCGMGIKDYARYSWVK